MCQMRLTVCAVISIVCMVFAQSGAAADSESQNAGLQEIVVTAEKRAEKLEDVPTAISAISGKTLDEQGAVQLSDYMSQLPSVNLVGGGSGPGNGELVIRGVTSGSDRGSPVGIYLDEVPFTPSAPTALTAPFSFDPELADIERVEVLAGPQSTLYGANAIGGLVKFVTKQPQFDSFEGSFRVEGTQVTDSDVGPGYGVRGSVNVPIVDDLAAARVSAFFRRDAGFINNEYDGQPGVNSDTVRGGRFSLRVRPVDNVETTLTGLLQDIDQTGPNLVYVDQSLKPIYGQYSYSSPLELPTTTKYRSLSDVTAVEWSALKLTNIASYSLFEPAQYSDLSLYSTFFPTIWTPGNLISFENKTQSKRYTDEFRLSSSPSRIEWLAGLFYTLEEDFNSEIARGTASNGSILPTSSDQFNVYDALFYTHFVEKAVFGDITVHVTDSLQGTVGVRYSDNNQAVHWGSTGLLGQNDVPHLGSSDSGESYLATISYKPNANTTLYARAASGYRPGGPNILNDVLLSKGAPATYIRDSLWNYELGIKGTSPDRRLSYTLDGYHIKWSDIQVTDIVDGFSVVDNSGSAQVDGGEGSLRMLVLDSLTVGVNGAYNHARFTSTAGTLGATNGDALPYAPRESVTAFADYTLPRWSGTFTPKTGVSYNYRSQEQSGYINGVTYRMPALGSLDARLGVDWSHYSALLKVTNVTNRYGYTGIQSVNALNASLGAVPERPRTIALFLQGNF
jgi:iron complex outermembrane receptor protein